MRAHHASARSSRGTGVRLCGWHAVQTLFKLPFWLLLCGFAMAWLRADATCLAGVCVRHMMRRPCLSLLVGNPKGQALVHLPGPSGGSRVAEGSLNKRANDETGVE
jgi:hypothetical protein